MDSTLVFDGDSGWLSGKRYSGGKTDLYGGGSSYATCFWYAYINLYTREIL